jgi:hypothetical protein
MVLRVAILGDLLLVEEDFPVEVLVVEAEELGKNHVKIEK